MEEHLKRFALEALENPHNPYSEATKGDIHCFDDTELYRYTMFVVTECVYIMAKQQKGMQDAEYQAVDHCIDAVMKSFKSVMKKAVKK